MNLEAFSKSRKTKKKEKRKKKKTHKKAKKAKQRKKLTTSLPHIQISIENICKKVDKERFIVR